MNLVAKSDIQEIVYVYDGSCSPHRTILSNLLRILFVSAHYTIDREYHAATFAPCEIQFFNNQKNLVHTEIIENTISSQTLDRVIATCVQYLNDSLLFVARDKQNRYYPLNQYRTQKAYDNISRDEIKLKLEKNILDILNTSKY